MKRIYGLVLLLGIISPPNGRGQTFEPATDWKIIKTPHVSVIFPAEIEADAQRVANTLETIHTAEWKNMAREPKPISVVLSNRSVEPNGFVALAPRRSQWETTPYWPSGLDLIGAGDWLNLLAVHEYRHVVQFDQMNTGWFRLAGLLSGESRKAVLGFITYPRWFMEGDAVGIETALTDYGRGRMPAFGLSLRTLALEGKPYSYAQAKFGSSRKPNINPYDLGYYLTTYVKREKGPLAWKKVMGTTNRWAIPGFTYALSVGLKRHTGLTERKLYYKVQEDLSEMVKEKSAENELTGGRIITPVYRHYTSYSWPKALTDGSLIAVKSGVHQVPTWVKIAKNGQETTLGHVESTITEFGFDVARNVATWSRSLPDPKYRAVGHSVIMTRNLETGDEKQLSNQTYWFLPAFSPDGQRIAVVEALPNRRFSLVILDADTGAEQARFDSPKNDQPSRIVWLPDGKRLAFNHQGQGGKAVSLLELASGKISSVVPYSWENITVIGATPEALLYQSNLNGLENVYALDWKSQSRRQITSVAAGANFASIAGSDLVYADYTANGYRLARLAMRPETWKSIADVPNVGVNYYEPMIEQEQGGSILQDVPATQYPTANYKSGKLHFHSWMPYGSGKLYGLTLNGANVLGNKAASIGLSYNGYAQTLGGIVSVSLSKKHPSLSLVAERLLRYDIVNNQTDNWHENQLGIRANFPYDLSKGTVYRSAQLSAGIGFKQVVDKNTGNGYALPMGLSASYNVSRESAKMDVRPRSGYNLIAAANWSPVGDLKGSQTLLYGSLNLPGLRKHDAIQLIGILADNTDQGYSFPSLLPIIYTFAGDMDQIRFASADYAFPIAYLDWGVGSLLYVRNVGGSVFAGVGEGNNSFGGSVFGAVNVLNFPISIQVGAYLIYNTSTQKFHINPAINLDL